ncbi:jerky protein homolog-like [Trichonephila clavipes]|nr:jerky protein homolog-like [Trichonephila clavipes]
MIQATGRPISRFAVARRLHGGGLFARRSVRRVPLTPAHPRRRSLWCPEHRNWRDNEWGRVLFTDESRFSLSSDSHRILIWRERSSRNHPSNIIERHRYGGHGVLVWGGIMLSSRTDLRIFDAGSVNGTRYCNEILLLYVRLFRGAMGLQFLFMDDNAPCHRTVVAEQLFENEDIEPCCLPPVTIRELRLALQDEWASRPKHLIDTLILSMGRRCETCLLVRESYSLLKTRCFLLDPITGIVGRESTEDDQRPGHLVTVSGVETVTKINQIVRADRRMSIRMIVEAVNADKETVREILHEELHMTKVCAKLVSKNLTPDQKLLRQQLFHNSWILHQDKAPAHNALSVKRYLTDKRTPVFEHAPYSPDLAPCDLLLFPKIKSALKGTRFESMEAVKQKTAELLKALTKEDFQHCFDQWKKPTICDRRKNRRKLKQYCANSSGETFENRQTAKQSLYDKVDNALHIWFTQERQRGTPLSGPIIQEKAIQLNKLMNGDASFSASIRWLDRWKKRHGVRQLTITGEKLSSDFDAAKEYVTTFANLIAEKKYSPQQTMPMRRA